jgi:hypothetical protein
MSSYRYSCLILMILEFSRQSLKKKQKQISNLMEVRPVGAELFYVDEQIYAQMDRLLIDGQFSQLFKSTSLFHT